MAKSAKKPSGEATEDAAEVRSAGDPPAADAGPARGRVRAPSKRARRSAVHAPTEEAGEEIAPEAAPAAEADGAAAAADAGEQVEGQDEDEWAYEIESSYLQSKYTLVSVAAKRARQLLDGSRGRVESLSDKPVTVALEELAQGKLLFEPVREAR